MVVKTEEAFFSSIFFSDEVFTWGTGNREDENGEDEWLLGFEMCGSDFLEFIVSLDLQD